MQHHTTAFILLLMLVLAACAQVEPEPGAAPQETASPTAEPAATAAAPATETPEAEDEAAAAVEAARAALAQRIGANAGEIEVVSSEQMEWPNACLGLPEAGEMCAEVVTPGWLVVLRVPGDDLLYEARTDQAGDVVRFQETADPTTELPVAAVRAREELAAELGVTIEQVEVVSFTQEEWTDSCLGLGGPAESCLQAITPGWLVLLSVEGQTYEVRTDRTGGSVRIAGPAAQGQAAIIFQRTGGIAGEDVTYRIDPSGMMEILRGPGGPDQPVEAVPVNPMAVGELLADLEEAGFFELATEETTEAPCCDRFVYYLTVTFGELTNSITVVEAEEDVSEAALRSVELVQTFVEEAGDGIR